MTKRKIIEIDSERCNGCGNCVTACAEGALALIDGKAHLVSDVYCDGLGACIGDCPAGAITVVERDAAAFDSTAGRPGPHTHGSHAGEPAPAYTPPPVLACGCPGSHEMTLGQAGKRDTTEPPGTDRPSELTHWPIKLRLLNPAAPYLAGADLLLLADCAAAACSNLHDRLLKGRCVALACPKFDDVDFSVGRLADIIRQARPSSIIVAHMEVPCCNGLFVITQRAVAQSGTDVTVRRVVIAREGHPVSGQDPVPNDGHLHAAGAV
jgi:NAD-dependent dihydropyrimidine dehydrogenase PreA subunit